MRALIIGHFSTIGDVDSLAYVTELLREEGVGYDVLPFNEKLTPYIDGAIRRSDLDPSTYSHVIVVCGPFWPELLVRRGINLEWFAHCTRIGVNLTMLEPTETWNPFHLLLERDSDRFVRPDVTFLQHSSVVPVVGLCTIDRQREYGGSQRHSAAVGLMRQLVDARRLAAVEIDTRWPAYRNSGGLGSSAQVTAVLERMDAVLTNRLHGMVYALKSGVPVLAIDPVEAGGKLTAQAGVLGWPAVSTVAAATPGWLESSLDWCLSEEGRKAAQDVSGTARAKLQGIGEQLRQALRTDFGYQPLPPSPAPVRRNLPHRLAEAIRRSWR